MFLVGKIVGTHGIKGELKVLSDTSFDRFKKGNSLYVDGKEKIVIDSSRIHKGLHLITVNGYTNINDVLKYVDKEIYVPHDRSELKDGEYYYEDLIGLSCFDSKNQNIGVVKDLQEVPQGLILEVETVNKKIVLIPYVKAFIKKIDLDNKELYINEIEGLL